MVKDDGKKHYNYYRLNRLEGVGTVDPRSGFPIKIRPLDGDTLRTQVYGNAAVWYWWEGNKWNLMDEKLKARYLSQPNL